MDAASHQVGTVFEPHNNNLNAGHISLRRPWIMAVAVDANDLGLITTVCPLGQVSFGYCRWNDRGLLLLLLLLLSGDEDSPVTHEELERSRSSTFLSSFFLCPTCVYFQTRIVSFARLCHWMSRGWSPMTSAKMCNVVSAIFRRNSNDKIAERIACPSE